MSDLIDRQAAIDAMQKLIIADDEESLMLMEYNQAVTDCIDKVAELPPVEQKWGWIPVSERLPEWHWETVGGEKFWVGERVLACVKEADEYYDLVGVATYGPYGWESSDEDFCSCYASKPVIAWMPLPEPYKASPTGGKENE